MLDRLDAIPVPALVSVAVAVAAAALASLVRVVRPGERLVIFRGGRPRRVRGPGVALVVPGRDSWFRLSIRPELLDVFWIGGRTADGLPLAINAQALLQVHDPATCAAAGGPPAAAAEAAVRTEVRRLVANRNAVALCRLDGSDLADLAERISESLAMQGMSITHIELSGASTDVDADLLRWADSLSGTRRSRRAPPTEGEPSRPAIVRSRR